MRKWLTVFAVAAMVPAASTSAAQTPKPAAKAPAASSARDLSGVWLGKPANQWSFTNEALPMQPEPEDRFKYNAVDWKQPAGPGRKELDPYIVSCAPPGIPRQWLINSPFEFIHRSDRIVIIYEADHAYRQVWTDGREHPKDFASNWTGHSIGKWEGDTLVIDTIGLNGESWLDNSGHVYSDAMHLTERIRRVDRNNLSIDITFDDTKAFTKTWTGRRLAGLQPGRVIRESAACDGVMNGE